jgi:Icc-related predicted phosphoesterase
MRIVCVGYLHGKMKWLPAFLDSCEPDLLLSVGDWGDPGHVSEPLLAPIVERVTTLTVSGNHDDVAMLRRTRNRDRSPVLLEQGEVRRVAGLNIAGISGIWASTRLGAKLTQRWDAARRVNPELTLDAWLDGRALPPYVTDQDMARLGASMAGRNVDILLTHGCAVEAADLTPSGKHGGVRSFRMALDAINPAVYICGHLHAHQQCALPGGRLALNCGDGGKKDGWLLTRHSAWHAEPLQA